MRIRSSSARLARAGVVAVFAFVAWAGSGQSTIPFVSSAMADTAGTLTPDQAAAVQASVATALANVDPSLVGAAKDQAIEQALAQATVSAIALYGPAAIAEVARSAILAGVPVTQVVAAIVLAAVQTSHVMVSTTVSEVLLGAVSAGASATLVTEAIIATTAASNLSPRFVGTGLGLAAAQLQQTNPEAAVEVAQTISDEGLPEMGASFASAVLVNGGSQQLADAGTQNPNAAASGTGKANGPQGPGGSSLPPCSNPSCT